jgi:hypothetical protein
MNINALLIILIKILIKIPDGLVDVDGEEGAGRVEDGGQVGHQGCQHHCDHYAPKHEFKN